KVSRLFGPAIRPIFLRVRYADKSRFGAIQIRIRSAEKSLINYRPSELEIGFPGGGVNSNVEGVIGARLWLEYVVTIRSPLDFNISVRCTSRSPLSRRLKR